MAQAVFVSGACGLGSKFLLTLLFSSILLYALVARWCQADESCRKDVCLSVIVAVVSNILYLYIVGGVELHT